MGVMSRLGEGLRPLKDFLVRFWNQDSQSSSGSRHFDLFFFLHAGVTGVKMAANAVIDI